MTSSSEETNKYLIDDEECVYDMDEEICNAFNKYFSSVNSGLENISKKITVSVEVGQGNVLPSGMDVKFKLKPIESLYEHLIVAW
jgi:hypothetical protein